MSDHLGPFDQDPTVDSSLFDELYALAAGHADAQLSREERQRLESLLINNDDLCDRFLDYMQMMSALENEPTWLREYLAQGTDILDETKDASPSVIPSLDIKDMDVFTTGILSEEDTLDPEPSVLGFLGDYTKSFFAFLSRPNVFSLLLAIGLPSLILVVLVFQSSINGPVPQQHSVAMVTQTYKCVWSESSDSLSAGSNLFAGEQLQLTEGLLEITFARGSTVLLKGPATFSITNGDRGFLHDGSLVAKVRKGSDRFTIRTPAIDVVDLGTEFGVCVDDKKRTADVEVFQGEVALQAANEKQPNKELRESLVAGQAVRVEVANRQGALPIIRKITPTTDTFVRYIPVVPVKPDALENSRVVLADFSDGEGSSHVDQYPGIGGLGWATGWRVEKTKHYKWSISTEETNPLLGGGKYLHVLLERESDRSNKAEGTHIERQLAMTGGVDLTKPYVVSFDYRIDALDGFPKQGEWLTLCSRSSKSSGNGWHISLIHQRDHQSGNWSFWCHDKTGEVARIDSEIPVREGDTYSFRILVDPETAQWTPSIAVNGGKWIEFESMGMRSNGTAKQNDYWPLLHLYCRMVDDSKGKDTKKISFSLDSFRIAEAKL
ncbi:MAG: FecR family protein [Planctomycetia bacterium]|jgi:hypothetical protein